MSSQYSDFVIPLLKSLRTEMMASYGNIEYSLKGDKSVVTEIDKRTEQKLTEALEKQFPDIGFHGEEFGRRGPEDKYWLIDPIDGTECYIRGLPGVTSIIGLVENGEVTHCYVYDLLNEVMYSAVKGEGAYADGKKISINNRALNRSIIGVSSSIPSKYPELMRSFKEAGVYFIATYFGSGIKAIYLASGKIDGIVIYDSSGGPWDYAPTSFLMKEAGAIYTEFDGKGIDSSSNAILSPSINDEVLTIIKGYL